MSIKVTHKVHVVIRLSSPNVSTGRKSRQHAPLRDSAEQDGNDTGVQLERNLVRFVRLGSLGPYKVR